jgi:polyphosphate kinase
VNDTAIKVGSTIYMDMRKTGPVPGTWMQTNNFDPSTCRIYTDFSNVLVCQFLSTATGTSLRMDLLTTSSQKQFRYVASTAEMEIFQISSNNIQRYSLVDLSNDPINLQTMTIQSRVSYFTPAFADQELLLHLRV